MSWGSFKVTVAVENDTDNIKTAFINNNSIDTMDPDVVMENCRARR